MNDEKHLLLGRGKKKVQGRFFGLNWLVTDRIAALILVMVFLVHTFDPDVAVSVAGEVAGFSGEDNILFAIYSGCSLFFYLFYPITGLYADIKFGRYKTGITALSVAWCSCVLMGVGTLLSRLQISTFFGFMLFSIGYIVGDFARCSFLIVILSFGVDQLLGASGEKLSAFMQWFYFCYVAGWAISVPLICTMEDIHNSVFALYGIHIFCVSIALFIMIAFRKHMIAEPQVKENPLTVIVKILKYAKNNRFPRNRSALTYWEDDYPSRLDLGKEKYGGPFTEEQVQDVKTLLRIIPLIVCMLVFFIMADNYPFLLEPMRNEYARCVLSSVHFINCTMIVATILLHQVVLVPFLYKCYPSMLQKIGIGIFLCVVAEGIWVAIDVFFHTASDACILNDLYYNNTRLYWENSGSWIMIPKIVAGLGFGTVAPTTLEFSFAQAPYSMRGVIVGIWFMTTGFSKTIGFSMFYPFKLLGDRLRPPCEFYLFITKFIIVGLSLVCFICLSFWYKLRFRGDRFDQHQTVEKLYSKYLEDKEEKLSLDYDEFSGLFVEAETRGNLQNCGNSGLINLTA